MSDHVNHRPYDNSRRAERSRSTRQAVIVTARELFLDLGFVETTIEAISASSGVSVATVYRLFRNKVTILKEVLDQAVVGDDSAVPLGERAAVRAAQSADSPEEMTAGFARVARQVFGNTAKLRLVLRAAAVLDPEAAALQASLESQRRTGQARVARALAQKGFLAPGLSEPEARDIVYALMSIDTYRILCLEQRWSGARYERWLGAALHQQLVSPPRS